MKFKTRSGCAFYMDKEDALKYVGISIYVGTNGYLQVQSKGWEKDRYVHRVVMNAKKGEYVDHINGNKLDNRKENLRICTQGENCYNSRIKSTNTSGYKGVYWCEKKQTWRSQISYKNKTIFLGSSENIHDVIKLRKEAEEKYHGEFSASKGVLNEKIKTEN